jgi:glutathione S-transferase
MAGGRGLHAGRHQFLFALRDDGRTDVPELEIAKRYPRLVEWRERVTARPAVKPKALAGEDRTAPGLRTWTGEVH